MIKKQVYQLFTVAQLERRKNFLSRRDRDNVACTSRQLVRLLFDFLILEMY
ncbi:hypothetical protein B6N60_03246 [Richelia sinica FACHB-800]|uniref:Uncharacterized protein n=1 Tax=Richelia sinica FACHB-800 TaxID=1357546 RepID=A0A975Y5S5_9NOST|nr:hypothetical protein B6N60_03246 [Richelia sinica FACHB-800]